MRNCDNCLLLDASIHRTVRPTMNCILQDEKKMIPHGSRPRIVGSFFFDIGWTHRSVFAYSSSKMVEDGVHCLTTLEMRHILAKRKKKVDPTSQPTNRGPSPLYLDRVCPLVSQTPPKNEFPMSIRWGCARTSNPSYHAFFGNWLLGKMICGPACDEQRVPYVLFSVSILYEFLDTKKHQPFNNGIVVWELSPQSIYCL